MRKILGGKPLAAAQVLTEIAIIIISFIIGFIFFYTMSPLSKVDKKEQLDELTSLIINFVIFIWLGKIILNIGLLVKDPFAVLAYPSNSKAFYLATLLILINICYKIVRHKFKIKPIVTTFVPVFLIASFAYEFIQIVLVQNAYSWFYLVLLMILVVTYALLHDRVASLKLSYSLMLTWTLGTLVLALTLPFTTVFGYMMSTWYLIVISIIQLVLIIYNRKRRDL